MLIVMRTRHALRRLILAIAISAGAVALRPAPAAADNLGYLLDLQEMEDVINSGNLLFIPGPIGVMPVHVDDYKQMRTFEILLNAKSPQDAVRQLAKLKGEITKLQNNGRQAIKEMIEETQKKMAQDDAAARDKIGVHAQGNIISDEERAESPAAPDAATRTLTVDNTPPPPPDGTPIVEAAAPPPPPSRDDAQDDDDAAINAAQTFIGIAGALTRQPRPRGNGGNHSGGQTQPQPNPHPRGC